MDGMAGLLGEIDQELCGLIARLAQQFDIHARRVAESLDITTSQVIALRELSDAMTLKGLAARMCCEPSNASFVIDRMETQGLVERHPDPTDRRAKQLVLTQAGQTCRAHVLEGLANESPLDALTTDERSTLRSILTTATS